MSADGAGDRPDAPHAPRHRWRVVVGFVIGIALFVAALWAVLGSQSQLDEAREAVRASPPWTIVALFGLPLLNLLATTGTFHALIGRFGVVRFGEMFALVATAGVLNYLPLRPGMFGRIAYHKRVNSIPIRHSVRVLVEAIAVSCGSLAALALAAGIASLLPGWTQWAVLPAPIVVAGVVVVVGRRHWAPFGRAFAWRYLDMGAWAARYLFAFHATGRPVTNLESVWLAVTSQLAMLVPVAGNGLGVREWAIGIAGGLFDEDAGAISRHALAADLVNRGAEVVVLVPVGVVAAIWVARRVARSKELPTDGQAPT